MSKVAVVYWSGTGNTEQMAGLVVQGAKDAGAEVSQFAAKDFAADQLDLFDAVAFGCPSMGDEVLEEDEFQPMFDACLPAMKGRKIALFGSYGWGDGAWMRDWEKTCRDGGAILIDDFVICQEAPDSDAEKACKNLGKALAS